MRVDVSLKHMTPIERVQLTPGLEQPQHLRYPHAAATLGPRMSTSCGFIAVVTQTGTTGKVVLNSSMTTLIEDLLRLSKVSRQEIVPTVIDLSEMAGSINESLREASPERNVAVSIQAGLTADADSRLMEIVLSNLFGNAWKFTSTKKKAHIDFGSLEKEGKTVYYVRDDGAGFDQRHVEKIF